LEELALPSVRASFKKWGYCTPILPKALAHFPNFQKFFFFKLKNFKKLGTARQAEASIYGRPATSGRLLAAGQRLSLSSYIHFSRIFFSSYPPLFVQVVISFSFTTAHARPAQASP
jgi:hypothetical protein